jgi:hypothetical protein
MKLPSLSLRLLSVLASGIALGAVAVRSENSLTIYNQDFAVAREAIRFELRPGLNDVTHDGVTLRLEPDSVVLRERGAARAPLRVLTQGYRAETASPGLMLSLFEGRELDFIVRDEQRRERTVRGKVVRSGHTAGGVASDSPIIEVDGQLRFSLPGEPVFPALADDAILRPALTWQIASDEARTVEAELSYLTAGLSWQAAYNLIGAETGDTLDIVGWVTMQNRSGKPFPEVNVKLMAGDVNKLAPETGGQDKRTWARAAMMVADAEVTERAFDEFHLYTLPRPVTLRDGETRQVEFLRARGVKAETIYRVEPSYGPQDRLPVSVWREFLNTAENGLGLPLPAGRTRFYREDGTDQQLEFTGENRLDHQPQGERVRLRTGDAFDLVAERRLMKNDLNDRIKIRSLTYQLTLRNRKDREVEIRWREALNEGEAGTVSEPSMPFERIDARTLEFRITVPAQGEKIVTYKADYPM